MTASELLCKEMDLRKYKIHEWNNKTAHTYWVGVGPSGSQSESDLENVILAAVFVY